jgi:hypothetical protein
MSTGDYEGAMSTMINVPLDREGNIIMRTLNDGFCKNCTVLAVKTDLVYEDGTRVDISNGVYVHHAVSFDLAWREMVNWINLCPIENQMLKDIELLSYLPPSFKTPFSIFGNAAVDEFQQWFASPDKSVEQAGYYIGDEDHFMMQAEMINYTKEQKQIFVQFDYEYLYGKIGRESTQSIMSTNGKSFKSATIYMGFFDNLKAVSMVSDSTEMVLQAVFEARTSKFSRTARLWLLVSLLRSLILNIYIDLPDNILLTSLFWQGGVCTNKSQHNLSILTLDNPRSPRWRR